MELLNNIVWGWCDWDTLVIILVIVATILLFARRYKLNKEIKELKDQI